MLSNPLTPPPNETSVAFPLTDNAIAFTLGSSYLAQQHASPATPTSNRSIGCSDAEEAALDDPSEPQDLSDPDLDVSDGGVPLTMGLPPDLLPEPAPLIFHAESMEMDGDVEEYEDLHLPLPGSNHQSEQHGEDFDAPDGDTSMDFGPEDTVAQPGFTLYAPQQHHLLQNWQQHADIPIVEDAQHMDAAHHNSIPPISLLPSLSAAILLLSTSASAGFASLAEISPPIQVGPGVVQFNLSDNSHSSDFPPSPETNVSGWLLDYSFTPLASSFVLNSDDDPVTVNADPDEAGDQLNLNLGDFLYNWAVAHTDGIDMRRRPQKPILSALRRQKFPSDLNPMTRSALHGGRCDIQRLNWEELGITRATAKYMRHQTYRNYASLRTFQWHPSLRLPNTDDFFRFRRMDFDHRIHLAHFQLRNLLTCPSLDRVFYAGRAQVLKWDGRNGHEAPSTAMDLSHPELQSFHAFPGGVQISTLASAHDILVAGGFCGEYGLINLQSSQSAPHNEGIISEFPNNITNHIQVQTNRCSGLPEAVFASNDNAVRILDCNTNRFVAEHFFDHAINCSAVSPDKRLRVLVGDSKDVIICNAETGEVYHKLGGHEDFGFACDWADDGRTLATGNQDMQIKIWDARKWTDSHGSATPLETLSADLAGVRILKFSPLGSGKRVLVAAEPADIISVIDADTFSSKQVLDFFGEIGGVDFTRDGNDVVVANCDNMRGGIMAFERCGWASEGLYSLKDGTRNEFRRGGNGYDWKDTEEIANDARSLGTMMRRERRALRGGVIDMCF